MSSRRMPLFSRSRTTASTNPESSNNPTAVFAIVSSLVTLDSSNPSLDTVRNVNLMFLVRVVGHGRVCLRDCTLHRLFLRPVAPAPFCHCVLPGASAPPYFNGRRVWVLEACLRGFCDWYV